MTLIKTIPSGSHNAPWNEVDGSHWPKGQEFTVSKYQDYNRKVVMDQMGCEEVRVSFPKDKLLNYFSVDDTREILKEVKRIDRNTYARARREVIANMCGTSYAAAKRDMGL
jgi:hypothetical protein